MRGRLQRAVQLADLAAAQAALQQRDALLRLHESLKNRIQVDALDDPARDATAAAEAAVTMAVTEHPAAGPEQQLQRLAIQWKPKFRRKLWWIQLL